MNKYYTPEIEEFHVGFEFESNYVLFTKDGKGDTWNKVIMSGEEFNWFYESYTNDAIKTEFRVKYLDKEDIESLGWKFSNLDKNRASINWIENPTQEQNAIWLVLGHKIQIIDCREKYHMTLFIGSIKNKSELKKLMQQLGINDNTTESNNTINNS